MISKTERKKMTGYEILGAQLKQFRKDNNLTLTKQSEKLNTSASYLSDIERGVSKPGLELLAGLRRVFKIDINKLFDDVMAKEKEIYPLITLKVDDADFKKAIEEMDAAIKNMTKSKPLNFWQKIIKAIKQFSNKTI